MLEASYSTLLKRLQPMFPCGFCQIIKKTYFTEYLKMTDIWGVCCIYNLWISHLSFYSFQFVAFLSKNYDANRKYLFTVKSANNLIPEIFSNIDPKKWSKDSTKVCHSKTKSIILNVKNENFLNNFHLD